VEQDHRIHSFISPRKLKGVTGHQIEVPPCSPLVNACHKRQRTASPAEDKYFGSLAKDGKGVSDAEICRTNAPQRSGKQRSASSANHVNETFNMQVRLHRITDHGCQVADSCMRACIHGTKDLGHKFPTLPRPRRAESRYGWPIVTSAKKHRRCIYVSAEELRRIDAMIGNAQCSLLSS
jgi:hypothetical protein